VVLFGGCTHIDYGYCTETAGDTWTWDSSTASWTPATGAGPEPRFLHAMAAHEGKGNVVLVAGVDEYGLAHGTTWEWDPRTRAWTVDDYVPGANPFVRIGPAFAFDPVHDQAVLFGGVSAGELGGVWALFSGSTNGQAAADTWTYGPAA
jgi:hypothetical protein